MMGVSSLMGVSSAQYVERGARARTARSLASVRVATPSRRRHAAARRVDFHATARRRRATANALERRAFERILEPY
jgi:hypothetical protein